jgi:hypothetical protein
MPITRTSFLEAVNTVLRMLGEAPVSSLDGDFGLAQQASDILIDASRRLQMEGWTFNTDYERTLLRNQDSEILVGNNVLRVVVHEYNHPHLDVVQRGAKLYDRRGNSYQFDQDLKADVTLALEWDELPEHARRYITVMGGRQLQQQVIGSNDLNNMNAVEEAMARSAFLELETTLDNHSMLQGDPNIGGPVLGYLPINTIRRM